MSMGYKKDIFRNFAYDFELSHKNEILACARTKSANADEIFGYASDEIKSTHPASSRISSNEVGFHRSRRVHPPVRVDLVEKDRFLSESVFFWSGRRGSNSLPPPWQGGALPDELRPHQREILYYIFPVLSSLKIKYFYKFPARSGRFCGDNILCHIHSPFIDRIIMAEWRDFARGLCIASWSKE